MPEIIEFEFNASPEEARASAESLMKIYNSLNDEQLEATADFISEHPDAVAKIEEWVRNPPAWMRPFIPKDWKE